MRDPATKDDLDQAMTTLRGEMGAMEGRLEHRIDQRISSLEVRISERFERLSQEFERSGARIAMEVANLMVEQLRIQVAALDDKYQDLPGHVATLRKDLDAHVVDTHLHRRSAATPGKRARRS